MQRFFIQSGSEQLYCVLFDRTQDVSSVSFDCSFQSGTGGQPVQSNSSKKNLSAATDAEAISLCIISHPFFEEKKDTRTLLIKTALSINRKVDYVGICDFRGGGESAGELSDFTSPDWAEDIITFINTVRQQYLPDAETKINLYMIGIRFGCVPLCMAVPELSSRKKINIEKITLCDPILDGRKYLNELLCQKRIRAMLTSRNTDNDNLTEKEIDSIFDADSRAIIDLDGYPLGSALYRDIRNVSPGTLFEYIKQGEIKEMSLVYTGNSSRQAEELKNFVKLLRTHLFDNLNVRFIKMPPYWRNINIKDKLTDEFIKEIC